MKKTLIIIVSLFLFGCMEYEKGLTNEEIIAETKKCTEAGLSTREAGYGIKITNITCTNR